MSTQLAAAPSASAAHYGHWPTPGEQDRARHQQYGNRGRPPGVRVVRVRSEQTERREGRGNTEHHRERDVAPAQVIRSGGRRLEPPPYASAHHASNPYT